MISFVIFLFLCFYIVIAQYKKTEQWKRTRLEFLCMLVLIFLSGFRHLAVGVDTMYYIYSLQRATTISFNEIMSSFFEGYFFATNKTKDPGFPVIEKMFSIITTNSTIYLLSIGAVFFVFLRRFFAKYTRTTWELVFAFIVYLALFWGYLPNAAIRQSIAMVFLLYVYSSFGEIKWYKSALYIILGSFIHQSILAGFIIFLFPYIKRVRTYYILCGILFGVMFVVGGIFAVYLSSFSDVYSSYAMSDYYDEGHSKPYNFIILMLLIYIVGLVCLRNRDFYMKNSFLYKMFGVAIVLTPLILIQPNFQRLTALFAIGTCAFLPRCLTGYSSYARKIAYSLLLIVFMYIASSSQFKFNWQDMKLHDRYLYMNIPIL